MQRTISGPVTARALVSARVARRAGRFPLLFPDPLDPSGLGPRDAALAFAIDQAVGRRWLTLVAVLESRLRRPWAQIQPDVQGALLVGAAQLLLLERLPDHAVINEAVTWIKTRTRAAAPLVNAVLRRVADLRGPIEPGPGDPLTRDGLVLHDGRVRRLREPVLAGEPLSRLARQTSHPPRLLERWSRRLGPDAAATLAAHGLVHPPVILTGAPPPAGSTPHQEAGFAVFEGDRAELRRWLDGGGEGARVQDPASAAAGDATRGLSPKLIVEPCAGKGTQTRQLAALHAGARLIASDAGAPKLETLRGSFTGHERVRVVEPDALGESAGRADLVVVDAPCSNTGVLSRRVEAKYRFGPGPLKSLVGVQRQVLADAVGLLAAGGHLLYSTCSLEPEENERQVEWLVRRHGLHVQRQAGLLPRGGPGDPASAYRDGGFFALLHRP